MKLTDLINEQHDFELTEEYPEGFDINSFKTIGSYAGKLRYAQEHLGKPIGSGSARTVYRVDKEKVLKLAKNKKGIAQNDQESNFYNDSYYETIIAKVIDFDDKHFLWVEMEVAHRAKKSDFMRLWGIRFEDMGLYLSNRYEENKGRRGIYGINPDVLEKMNESDEIMHLVSFMYDSNQSAGDISKISSWGIVHRVDGEYLVLLDFGLSDDVYASYYGVN